MRRASGADGAGDTGADRICCILRMGAGAGAGAGVNLGLGVGIGTGVGAVRIPCGCGCSTASRRFFPQLHIPICPPEFSRCIIPVRHDGGVVRRKGSVTVC